MSLEANPGEGGKIEQIPVVETVRVALFHKEKFLILEKTGDSKNPLALEFPGGKIDDLEKDKESTLEEQKETAIREVEEEAKIEVGNLPVEKIEDYGVYFEAKGKDGKTKRYKRVVHLFLIRLPESEDYQAKINQTLDVEGGSEDKHKSFKWVSPEGLIDSVVVLAKNQETGERMRRMSRNSRHIKKLLQVVGYLNKEK